MDNRWTTEAIDDGRKATLRQERLQGRPRLI